MRWCRIDDWLAGLIDRPVLGDPAERLRQERFAVGRTATALASAGALPLSLFGHAASGLLEVWAVMTLAPLASVFLLSRRGRLAEAQALMSAALTLLAVQGASPGGSLLMSCLTLFFVPVEASASGSRGGLSAAAGLSLVGLALVLWEQVRGAGGDPGLPAAAAAMVVLALGAGHAVAQAFVDRRPTLPPKPSDHGREASILAAQGDLVTWHDRNGGILRCNGASAHLLHLQAAAIQGDGLFARILVVDRPLFLKAVSDVAHGADSAVARFRVRTGEAPAARSGIHLWVEMRVHRPAPAEDGPCVAVAVTRDISELMRAVESCDALRREAAAAAAARAEMLAAASRELRAPIETIVGYAGLLAPHHEHRADPLGPRSEKRIRFSALTDAVVQEGSIGSVRDATSMFGAGAPAGTGPIGLAARREDYPGLIAASGHRMLGAVDALADLSAIEAGSWRLSPEPLDIAELVRECCALAAPAAEKAGCRLAHEPASGLPAIVADRDACRRILLNLLSDAVSSAPRGGTVEVDLRRDGDGVAMTVSEARTGVPGSGSLRAVRLPGPTGTGRRDGTEGLGLSVVRALVDLHRGRVQVAGRPGDGCVRIVLPIGAGRGEAGKPADQEAISEPGMIVLKTG